MTSYIAIGVGIIMLFAMAHSIISRFMPKPRWWYRPCPPMGLVWLLTFVFAFYAFGQTGAWLTVLEWGVWLFFLRRIGRKPFP